jgi:hypothetical protein
MKKIIFVLLLAVLSVQAYSQEKGNLAVGLKGGYVYSPHYYNGTLYGVDVAYSLSDPLEVVFTGMMNPDISYSKNKLSVYSTNLDLRLYLINQREWGIGPALGGQYYIVDNKSDNLAANKALGFNLGIHGRVNLTDNLTLNGGWRYTNAKAKNNQVWWDNSASFDMSYNLFYLGIAYTFQSK